MRSPGIAGCADVEKDHHDLFAGDQQTRVEYASDENEGVVPLSCEVL